MSLLSLLFPWGHVLEERESEFFIKNTTTEAEVDNTKLFAYMAAIGQIITVAGLFMAFWYFGIGAIHF